MADNEACYHFIQAREASVMTQAQAEAWLKEQTLRLLPQEIPKD